MMSMASPDLVLSSSHPVTPQTPLTNPSTADPSNSSPVSLNDSDVPLDPYPLPASLSQPFDILATSSDIESLRASNASLKSKATEAILLLQSTHQDRLLKEKALVRLTRQVSELNRQLTFQGSLIASQKQENATLLQRLSQSERKTIEYSHELVEKKSFLQELTFAVENLKKERVQWKDRCMGLESEKKAMEREIQRVFGDKEEEIKDYKGKNFLYFSELQEKSAELEIMKRQLGELSGMILGVQEELRGKERNCVVIQREKESLESEIQSYIKEIESYKIRLNECKDKESEYLKSQMERREEKKLLEGQMKGMAEKILYLMRELQKSDELRVEMNSKMDEMKREMDKNRLEWRSKEDQYKGKDKEFERLQHTNGILEERVAKQKQMVNEWKLREKQLEKQIVELQNEKRRLKENGEHLQLKLGAKKEKREMKEKEIKEKEKEAKENDGNNNNALLSSSTASASASASASDLVAAHDRIDELQSQLDSLQFQIQSQSHVISLYENKEIYYKQLQKQIHSYTQSFGVNNGNAGSNEVSTDPARAEMEKVRGLLGELDEMWRQEDGKPGAGPNSNSNSNGSQARSSVVLSRDAQDKEWQSAISTRTGIKVKKLLEKLDFSVDKLRDWRTPLSLLVGLDNLFMAIKRNREESNQGHSGGLQSPSSAAATSTSQIPHSPSIRSKELESQLLAIQESRHKILHRLIQCQSDTNQPINRMDFHALSLSDQDLIALIPPFQSLIQSSSSSSGSPLQFNFNENSLTSHGIKQWIDQFVYAIGSGSNGNANDPNSLQSPSNLQFAFESNAISLAGAAEIALHACKTSITRGKTLEKAYFRLGSEDVSNSPSTAAESSVSPLFYLVFNGKHVEFDFQSNPMDIPPSLRHSLQLEKGVSMDFLQRINAFLLEFCQSDVEYRYLALERLEERMREFQLAFGGAGKVLRSNSARKRLEPIAPGSALNASFASPGPSGYKVGNSFASSPPSSASASRIPSAKATTPAKSPSGIKPPGFGSSSAKPSYSSAQKSLSASGSEPVLRGVPVGSESDEERQLEEAMKELKASKV